MTIKITLKYTNAWELLFVVAAGLDIFIFSPYKDCPVVYIGYDNKKHIRVYYLSK